MLTQPENLSVTIEDAKARVTPLEPTSLRGSAIVNPSLAPSEVQRIAEEAYIYGFAIVENDRAIYRIGFPRPKMNST